MYLCFGLWDFVAWMNAGGVGRSVHINCLFAVGLKKCFVKTINSGKPRGYQQYSRSWHFFLFSFFLFLTSIIYIILRSNEVFHCTLVPELPLFFLALFGTLHCIGEAVERVSIVFLLFFYRFFCLVLFLYIFVKVREKRSPSSAHQFWKSTAKASCLAINKYIYIFFFTSLTYGKTDRHHRHL